MLILTRRVGKAVVINDDMKINLSIGFLGALAIAFITLKLCHIIFWSWWLVLLPFYGCFVVLFGILFLTLFAMFMAVVLTALTLDGLDLKDTLKNKLKNMKNKINKENL